MKIIILYKENLTSDFFNKDKKKVFKETNESYKQFVLDTAELQRVRQLNSLFWSVHSFPVGLGFSRLAHARRAILLLG